MLAARPSIRSLASSKIRELFNEGFGADLLPFWVGEPDEPTPEFIRRAGLDSINAGETFYTHNLGIPELRGALSAYLSKLHGRVPQESIAVTSAGVNALMLVSQLLVDPGERVVEVVPLWPNLQEIPKILGAHVTTVALEFSRAGWRLDLDRLLDSLTPGTRAGLHQFAEQPDRMDDHARSAARGSRALPQARHLDFCRRRVRADLLRGRRSRAVVLRSRPSGRSPDQREHVLEDVADGGVATGMDRPAA